MNPLRASMLGTLPATAGPTPSVACPKAVTMAHIMSIITTFLLGI
jgi:hypothetical protein